MPKFPSFDDFVATRRFVPSLFGAKVGFNEAEDCSGFVYMDSYYIQENPTYIQDGGPRYYWVVMNESKGFDKLSDLEESFYQVISDLEGWVLEPEPIFVDVEFTIRMRCELPQDFDEKQFDGVLMYITEALDDNYEGTVKYEMGKCGWNYGPKI
jgi:hypothetical protein